MDPNHDYSIFELEQLLHKLNEQKAERRRLLEEADRREAEFMQWYRDRKDEGWGFFK